MRTPEQVQWDFVLEWVKKAGNDMRAAKLLIEQDFEDFGTAAFHAQQAAEKYLKAYLVRHQIEFRKTHDLKMLRDVIKSRDTELAADLSSSDDLTPYAVEFRYPGDIVPRGNAQLAIALAEQVRSRILAALEDYLAAGRPS